MARCRWTRSSGAQRARAIRDGSRGTPASRRDRQTTSPRQAASRATHASCPWMPQEPAFLLSGRRREPPRRTAECGLVDGRKNHAVHAAADPSRAVEPFGRAEQRIGGTVTLDTATDPPERTTQLPQSQKIILNGCLGLLATLRVTDLRHRKGFSVGHPADRKPTDFLIPWRGIEAVSGIAWRDDRWHGLTVAKRCRRRLDLRQSATRIRCGELTQRHRCTQSVFHAVTGPCRCHRAARRSAVIGAPPVRFRGIRACPTWCARWQT